MKNQKPTLPDKPFFTIEEAATRIGCTPQQLLDYAFVKDSQEQRFGKLRVHAIFPASLTNQARKTFVSNNQTPLAFDDYLAYEDKVDIDVDALLGEFEKTESMSKEEIEEESKLLILEDHILNIEQSKLCSYGSYNTEVTITPKNFILLDIENLIEFINADTVTIQKAYLEGYESELVELDYTELEDNFPISRKNLRILSDNLEDLISPIAETTNIESNDELSDKGKSYFLAVIAILIHGNNWKIEDKDLAEKIITLSESTNYCVGIGALRKHLKYLRYDHEGFRRPDPIKPNTEA